MDHGTDREKGLGISAAGEIREGTTRESLPGVNLDILDSTPVVDKRVYDPTDDR